MSTILEKEDYEELKKMLTETVSSAKAWQEKYGELAKNFNAELEYQAMRREQLRIEKNGINERERALLGWGLAYGRKTMAWDLAVWKNGKPKVGVNEGEYADFVRPYEESLAYQREFLQMTDCQILSCSGCPDCKPKPSLTDGVEDLAE